MHSRLGRKNTCFVCIYIEDLFGFSSHEIMIRLELGINTWQDLTVCFMNIRTTSVVKVQETQNVKALHIAYVTVSS